MNFKQGLSLVAFLAFHLTLGASLMYTVASPKNVTKGIEQSLKLGVTR